LTSSLLQWLATLSGLFAQAFRDLLPALRELGEGFIASLRRCFRHEQRTKNERRRARTRCVPINAPPFVRPDPLIYCQSYLMSQGLAVTWDNPDIQLFKGGLAVPSSQLDPDTDYDVVARIWNNSTEAPVVGLPVRFSYLSFGVGAQNTAIGDTNVNLGVKGGPDHPAFATMTWRTPVAPDHYCIQVFLDWRDDANPINNLGQKNTEVCALHSAGQLAFTLRNATHETFSYRFEIDTYELPKPRPCGDVAANQPTERGTDGAKPVPAMHDRRNYPLPAGWSVEIEPTAPKLAPEEEQLIRLTVTAPDGFKGRQRINVHAFYRYGLAGGVTFDAETT
jgi:hypothetical protein